MDDRSRGLYSKYSVTRTDGSSAPGCKHHDCDFFVLDLSHDPHAWAALQAYATSCKLDFPRLAEDLQAKINNKEAKEFSWTSSGDPQR